MSLKSIVKELMGIVATREETRCRGRRSHISPEGGHLPRPCSRSPEEGGGAWAGLPPELLRNIIQRVEAVASTWPGRRDVVACASVCKTWREIANDVVNTPEKCGRLTFPISLKQPGPRDAPIQCFIRRDRATSTYLLYLGLSPSLSGDASKLLLAAKKIRRATTGMDFRISLGGSDFCQTSNNFAGKLRSNFLGTKFTIYDSQLPQHSATRSLLQYNGKRSSIDASASMLARDYDVATICYELNIFRTRGPRRMLCAMHSIPLSSIREGGNAPTPTEFRSCPDGQSNSSIVSKTKHMQVALSSTCLTRSPGPVSRGKEPLVLRNKSPRWHEQLQCWCLNFKGRVTVASVKNFQLVAAVDSSQNVPSEEQEKVILQFGKIGKDIFTMDYRYPLSAFQAFSVCLSSFDTKPACE